MSGCARFHKTPCAVITKINILCQCMLCRMRTSVLFIGGFGDSFSNPYVRKCQLVEFLLMLEMKGFRKGEIQTFSVLHCARGNEVIYKVAHEKTSPPSRRPTWA